MKRFVFILMSFVVFIFLILNVLAAQTNGTSYTQNVVVSVGGESINGTTYRATIAIGILAKIINSTSYINKLGFFHTWLNADDQPCDSGSQCQGGFCCSNLCKSSACPSGGSGDTGGAAAIAAGAGGGGGGGGGGLLPTPIEEPKIRDFSLKPSFIKEELALGQAKTRAISIKNTGNTALNFDLSMATINDLVFLSDTSFTLKPSEEKVIEVNLIGKRLGSFIGQLEAKAEEIKKYISIVIDVESEQVLFDAKIDIPSGYTEIEAGKELKAQITLLNVGPPRKVDVTTTYTIKDRYGKIVHESSETFAVENQISFVKSFKIPERLEPGDYLLTVELIYENSFAVSSELFKVLPKEISKIPKPSTALIPVFIVFIGILFLFSYLLLPKIRLFRKYGVRQRRKRR